MEWYQSNSQLQEIEIKEMNALYPNAKWVYLPNGQMYWTIIIHPVIFGEEKEWTLLAVYDSDHPHKKWGGPLKIYPVRPNYNKMLEMVNNSLTWPKCVPHLLSDNDSQIYLSSCIICNREEKSNGELTTLAVTQLRYALR